MRIGVIDYGVGNLGSVLGALDTMGVTPFLVDSPERMGDADRLILPGVGNFGECIATLNEGGWSDALHQAVAQGKPLLGICVGMQLLAELGTECTHGYDTKGVPGLGFIPGRIENLRQIGCNDRVPHVGWNGIATGPAGDTLLTQIPDGTDFYFVHSYAFVPEDPDTIAATVEYGVPITAAVAKGRVWGTQFHPEKSSRAGFQVIRNFLEHVPC